MYRQGFQKPRDQSLETRFSLVVSGVALVHRAGLGPSVRTMTYAYN